MTLRNSELSVRAHNCLIRELGGYYVAPPGFDPPLEGVLGLKSNEIKNLGVVTFCDITHTLVESGTAVAAIQTSVWWQSAPKSWRDACQLQMFYIRNMQPVAVGNCALWCAEGGHGYTCDLKKAWRVDGTHAASICRDRPEQDKAYPCEVIDRLAVLHVDVQEL
jgi:hypothetical protein